MKFFLALFTVTMSLGSLLAMKFRLESYYTVIIYMIGVYQLYRVNYNSAFFLTFLRDSQEEKQEQAKLRLGPGEFNLKDEAEKNEDKFHDMFDWKKLIARQVVSWGLFAASIYVYFFRIRVEVSMETVMPLISFLFITRAVSVGHLLVPLAINLSTLLFFLPEFTGREYAVFLVYGILFIVNLALIYPSEERLGIKIKDWLSGKWVELLSTIGILLITFMVGKSVFGDMDLWKKKEPQVRKIDVQRQLKKIQRLESSLKRMTEQGLFQNKSLANRTSQLADKMKELSKEEKVSRYAWKECKNEGQQLEKEANQEISESKGPPLSDKLLEEMKADVRSRQNKGLDAHMEKKLEDFLKRAENFKGSEGNELISDYKGMKFGKGGFYQEETEFAHDPAVGDQNQFLEKMKNAEEEKKNIVEKLNRNIEEMKSSPDDGSMSINKSLKDELDQVDSLSSAERENLKQELARTAEFEKNIQARTHNPELREKMEKLEAERRHLENEMTPHMNARSKSELAQKILNHQKAVEAAGQEVKSEIMQNLKREEAKNSQDENKQEDTKSDSQLYKKILKFGVIALAGILIAWFMRKLGKKGIKKVEGIPEEIKDEIIQDLKALKRKELSPREEVIEFYNILHNALQTLIFIRETPPSCIVYEGIKSAEPELKDPTFTVTERFALTFYGGHDVTGPDLRTFRRDIRKIFSFFGITF